MAHRRRAAHPDYTSVKNRASFTDAVSKARDKFTSMPRDSPEEVRGINTRDVDRILASLDKTEKGFQQNLDDAQEFCPTDEADEQAFQLDEDNSSDSFNGAMSMARDVGEQLLTLKAVLNGLSNFRTDLSALQESLDEEPDSNQVESLQCLNILYGTLRTSWDNANLDPSHPIKGELDSCRKLLTSLGAKVASARDKSDSHSSTISASSSHPSERSGCCSSKSDLPVIEVPKFHGNIMAWSTFWTSFESTIGNRKDLDNTKRLHYLRMAIKDEESKKLLYSPTETPDFYLEVVEELKRRFNRTREVHRVLTKNILDLHNPKQTRSDLRKLTDQVNRIISSFKATGFYSIDSFLCSTVYLLLPMKLQTSWDQHTKKDKGVPTIHALITYLQDYAEALPACNSEDKTGDAPAKKPRNHSQNSPNKKKGQVNAVTPPNPEYKWEYWICKPLKHPLHICPKWASYSVSQRLGHVKSRNLCSNCLAGGHPLSQCKSTYRCRDCGQNHHTSIHQDAATPNTVNSAASKDHQVPEALMTIAQVLLTGPRGQEVKVRALIDSGAGLSLVSHKVAQTLGLPLHPSNLLMTGVQGTVTATVKYFTDLTISPLLDRRKKIPCSPAVVPVVTANIPGRDLQLVHELPHILGLHLADEQYHLSNKIDLLLGADMAPMIMTKQIPRTGKQSEAMAQATEFGWVISGPVIRSRTSREDKSTSTNHLQPEEAPPPPPLEQLVSEFWQGEELPGDQESSLSQMEEQAEQHYCTNTIYLPEQCRYQVTLPRKTDMKPLGDSRPQAASRYLSNERSILKRQIWEPFQKVVQTYLDLGHAEPVPPAEPPPQSVYYLPMHAVMKESSSTTKLRVVFDGSAITSSGTSLNQSLLVGPTLQPTLSNILLKFRSYSIALNADIAKMYREVLLHPPDKDLHRFIWRASTSDPIQDFRMCRVTFGVSASPYLAVRTLQKTAKDHGEEYPEVTNHILSSFYVDDFLGGADSTQEAMDLFTRMRSILEKAST